MSTSPEFANPIVDILVGTTPLVSWLLPELLPQGSLVVLAGEPGAGKSFLSYTLGLALATHTPVLNRCPDQARTVLYFDQENSRPDRDEYLRWAWRGLGCPDLATLQQRFWPVHFALGSRDWASTAARWVHAIQPHLFIIDTATPACNIQIENDNGEASRVINQLRALQALVQPACTALILKHAKITQDTTQGYILRGAKAWAGGVDSIIFHVRKAGHPRKDHLSNTKLVPAKTRAFGLRTQIHIRPEWIEDGRGLQLFESANALNT